jgi:hypothetical protein
MIAVDIARSLGSAQQDALAMAIDILKDELSDDLVNLRAGVHPSETRTARRLPPCYRGHYDTEFVRRFAACFSAVAGKLYSPDRESLACVAEELGLYVLLEEAEALLEKDGTEAAFSDFDMAFEDMDFEWLYDPAFDGIEDSEAVRELRMVNLALSDWFKPFRPDDPVHP